MFPLTTLGPAYNEQNLQKKLLFINRCSLYQHYNLMSIILFNAKKSAGHGLLCILTKLVVNGTQCRGEPSNRLILLRLPLVTNETPVYKFPPNKNMYIWRGMRLCVYSYFVRSPNFSDVQALSYNKTLERFSRVHT